MSHSDEEELDATQEESASLPIVRKIQAVKFADAFTRILAKRNAKESGLEKLGTKVEKKQKVESKDEAEAQLAVRKSREHKLMLKKRGHILPLKKGEDTEVDQQNRRLLVTATRGVVQLFNAVRKAQREIEEDNPTPKSSKVGFLAELKGAATQSAGGRESLPMHPQSDGPIQDARAESSWDVLRDDFLAGRNRLRDWDKDGEEDAHEKGSGSANVDDESGESDF
mmetsp:Transcript_16111/g.22248  ORF Transcript_16111/g.22248 Transcript_16111/m.22248 type:complete len:225 (-) Transcript_16111:31-705(-)|eukprot:CAMPEP_0196588228 /NCGR_PEP_ID=MMETSP1081-20130531/59921_1 /TAXON_ID=36882 /ORGANISM="Pyramimonas amylifera, Strain CCMP720" /LENGTH=224 /DNA_ID=CAMNT_0041910671 /DNA_START=155 /DNA_END=832 /DNA_ORIENTATION=+